MFKKTNTMWLHEIIARIIPNICISLYIENYKLVIQNGHSFR